MSDPRPGAVRTTPGYGLGKGAAPGERLPWERVSEWLEASRNYWVCTMRGDGRPHAMPVWGVWLDGSVIFSTDPASTKGRNIAARPELVVHLESGDDVAILEGWVEPLDRGDLLDHFIEAYDAKYGFHIDPGEPSTGIYRFRPRVALSWQEKDFPESATRWSFPAA